MIKCLDINQVWNKLAKKSSIYNVNNETFDKSRQYQKRAIVRVEFRGAVIASIELATPEKSLLQGNKLDGDR
ncbi:hypothetical protein T4B_6392 [Trichinella pseudospiralis]|uniref:Uncharacterized protein n=1 Tax=Trichinella pseudospiralis TaxID=6337 RepID=A0A0V1DUV6_TRIPS|nr:hypothetical protein T4A_9764 [Trichinella pseudospiralis]KRZ08384.1 hypothetical protein T4B_6392 [Trichinella pseudospiralis]KRZ35208.1 hypothetical protein T4C_11370 [Trichinella pseudospiralis]